MAGNRNSDTATQRGAESALRCCEFQVSSFKFQDSDFRCCVLKGQGVAQLYNANDGLDRNMPRQSGDIDLWVSGGMKNVLAWARAHYGDVSYDYVNAHLPMFPETEVELHWRVSSMTNLFSAC